MPQLSPAFAMASPHTLFPLPPADQPVTTRNPHYSSMMHRGISERLRVVAGWRCEA